MEFFKCKMCGGELDIVNGTDIAKCSCCGSKQTVPALTERLAQEPAKDDSPKGVKKLISQLKSKAKKKEKKAKKEKPLSEKKQAKLAKKQAKLQAKEDKKRAKAEAKGKVYTPKKKASKKKAIIVISIILGVIILMIVWAFIIAPSIIYNHSVELFNQGEYITSGSNFKFLSQYLNYKDSAQYLSLCEMLGNVTFN